MEERETMLLQKLQTTQSKQTQAYRSLESMVQVGYNYYSQCYELKKKKQADMLPGMAGVGKGVRSGVATDSASQGGPGIYMNRGMQNARSPKTGALSQSQSVKKLQKKKPSMGPGPGMSANQSAAAAEFYGSNQVTDPNASNSGKNP